MPVSLKITHRQAYADGAAFDTVGPYECIEGTVKTTIDPSHPRHARIVDLALAPRDARGMVVCRAAFRILRPLDPSRGNRRLLFDVVNRGNPTVLSSFNQAASPLDPGDGFLMRRGYTIAACGWQGDLLGKTERIEHDFPPAPARLRAHVPEALTESGEPIVGLIAVTFQPDARICVSPLAAGAQRPHPSVDPDDPDAVLYVRDHANAPHHIVPRADWSFARLVGGRVVPDTGFVYLPGGFEPHRIYTVVNTASEYWRGDAALIHIAPDGSRDLAISDRMRLYHYAGTQHGPGRLPVATGKLRPSADRLLANVIDYRPLLRAALVRLDQWAMGAQLPPPSCYPRLDDATAVAPERVAEVFRGLPGASFPGHLPGMHRLDFGPQAGEGLLTRLPPAVGQAYPTRVPTVDSDGNELVGVRPPALPCRWPPTPAGTCAIPWTDGASCIPWSANVPVSGLAGRRRRARRPASLDRGSLQLARRLSRTRRARGAGVGA